MVLVNEVNISILLWVCVAFSQIHAERIANGFISIPLKRSESIPTAVVKDNLISLQSKNTISSSRKIQKEKLAFVQYAFYSGEINIGTPPQKLNVQFDTGSPVFWVFSSVLCNTNETKCKDHKVYDHCKSKSYKPDGRRFEISYEIGYTRGFLSQDDFSIGDLKGTGQVFGEGSDVAEVDVETKYDGLIGLTFSPTEFRNKTFVDPPLLTLFRQKKLKHAVFAFFLADPKSQKQSELALGGVDPTKFKGPFIFTPATSDDYWVITVNKISIGNSEFKGPFKTVIDSDSTAFGFPTPIFNRLVLPTQLQFSEKYGVHLVDCDKVTSLPMITVTISNSPFTFKGEEYALEFIDDDTNERICWVGATEYDDAVILALKFLQKYYTQFNGEDNKVGMAVAVQ